MMQFFGNELPLVIPANDQDTGDLPAVFGVNTQRRDELIAAVSKAAAEATKEPVPGMPAYVTGFRVSKFVGEVEIDALSPSELVFVGMLMGRTYATMEEASKKAFERMNKMMHLMATNPAKAHKKMLKSLKKKSKENGK